MIVLAGESKWREKDAGRMVRTPIFVQSVLTGHYGAIEIKLGQLFLKTISS